MMQRLLNAIGLERRSLENPSKSVYEALADTPTHTGVVVNEQTAMGLSAVYSCVKILSESVASLPLITYRRLENGGKVRANEHWLYALLHDSPNPETGSFHYLQVLTAHLLLWGNSYSEIVRDGAGRVKELWPIAPSRVTVAREHGRKVYRVALADGRIETMPADSIFHVPGFGFNPDRGESVVGLARQSIGMGLAAQEYGAHYFGNGANPSLAIRHPQALSPEARLNIANSWNAQHQGVRQSHRVTVLDEGMDLEALGVPHTDMQFLELRQFQVEEIARIFRVPPVMLAHNNVTTWGSGIEQLMIGFVQHSLRPILVRIEREISRSLIPESERATLHSEFLVDGLLRADSASRTAAYQIMLNTGIMSINEVRQRENLNPIEGGDTHLVPVQFQPLDVAIAGPPQARSIESRAAIETRSVDARSTLQRGYVDAFRKRADRIVKKEIAFLRAADPTAETFGMELDRFYEEHSARIAKEMLPVLMSLSSSVYGEATREVNGPPIGEDAATFIKEYADTLGLRESISAKKRIQSLVADTPAADLPDAYAAELDHWAETRADTLANRETNRAGNAVAKLAYTAAGVTLFRWRANAGACPLCDGLDGKVVGAERAFVEEGETVEGEGTAPLTSSSRISHPPLHAGCTCAVVPELE